LTIAIKPLTTQLFIMSSKHTPKIPVQYQKSFV